MKNSHRKCRTTLLSSFHEVLILINSFTFLIKTKIYWVPGKDPLCEGTKKPFKIMNLLAIECVKSVHTFRVPLHLPTVSNPNHLNLGV